ncbi:MAG: LamB/YcsF family protein [Fimbriimonadaceae bacterium]|nr:LamB/YcsF family protein [Fimbriimonadaceae bacterium]
MKRVDLNVDIAEGFPNDDALLSIVSSANVCCGEHAGLWDLTSATVAQCRTLGIRVGIHPGFPDREGMGRRNPSDDLLGPWAESLQEQVARFVAELGADYIKPHGAWYNLMTTPAGNPSGDWARRVALEIALEYRLPIMMLAGSEFASELRQQGVAVITEGFADRGYTAAGTLIPRTQPGAVLTDHEAVVRQALDLASRVNSICLHGDTEGCVDFAQRIRTALESGGWEIRA